MTDGIRGSNAPLASAFSAVSHFFGLEDVGGGSYGFRRIPVNDVRPYGMFKVHRNGVAQSGMSAGLYNKIQFTTRSWDYNSLYNISTNYIYFPLVAGVYEFGLTVLAAGISGDRPQAVIYKNGAIDSAGTYDIVNNVSSLYYSVCHAQVLCNGSTDFVEAYVYLPPGITSINGNAINTFFFGRRIG